MTKTMQFFCAHCGAKFPALAYIVKGKHGEELISCEFACPRCGEQECYSDTETGHRQENAAALAYETDLAAAEADPDED